MDYRVILMLIGAVISLCGAVFIFEARDLTKKLFSFGDQNEASTGFKILGFILLIIGFIVIFYNH